MNCKSILTAAASALLALTALGASAAAPAAAGSGEKTKILCLGDSITDGYWEQGAYRKYLYMALGEQGYDSIDMVGPKGGETESFTYNGETVTYDGGYAGYSGYAIQYMEGTETRQGILETIRSTDMISTYAPDIVLLQIGTNDILSAYNDGIIDRLENLVNVILSDLPDGGTVFVSTIPDMDVALVESWLWAYGEVKWNNSLADFTAIVQGYVDSYNASIAAMVADMQAEGKPVRFADTHSVVDLQTDLYDGVHPNEQGYEKMGRYWAGVLDGYMNSSSGAETTAAETTTVSGETTATETTTAPVAQRTGDVNADGEINMADAVLLARWLVNADVSIPAEQAVCADLDQSGTLQAFDLAKLLQLIQIA